ncbi:hypothetical protein CJU90_2210 [Yarrowia sp. C11]|nr:hypothetical protein CKK34_6238 [Yarrowia sp. E02]KAG5372131.1 hypothetical protein CJU90_2210 [Yarrowia sp. C11]
MSTLLKVLGLANREHTPFQIDQAYRNRTFQVLALLPSDSEPFYAVSDAYQVLRNPSQRAKYVELGDKQFFDQCRDIQYIDAVDILLGSFGVDKLQFLVPDIPAFSIIVSSYKETKNNVVTGMVPLEISARSLDIMRRPGWIQGKAKVRSLLKQTRGDYSRVSVMPQMREMQHLIDDYNGEKGNRQVKDKLVYEFRQTTLGLDWMHVVATVFSTRGANQYNKCRKLINNRSDIECPTKGVAYMRKYVIRAQKFWKTARKSYDDQVNMFYLACACSLIMEVKQALDKTIDYLFDAQKQQIPKRKDRMVPAKRLADMGAWMGERDEVFITYDDVLASAITHTAYHVVYVVTKLKKSDIYDIRYILPESEFPERSRTLVKIALDVYKAEDLSRRELARQNMMAMNAAPVITIC